jgi:aminoglycoside/choline kinase family phosphotransferase/dTDP-glucose pyrophosphorylase
MKAMILAAGFGTRLQPFTSHTPKPLFTLANQPILDIIVNQLYQADCEAVMVNCHHLSDAIQKHVHGQSYPLEVQTVVEDQILGSAGALKNVADFWDQTPFLVVNGDIYFNYNLKKIYNFHQNHGHPVTMVLCDDSDFNTVCVDQDHFVTGFQTAEGMSASAKSQLTFTGIHVIDTGILDHIAPDQFVNIIDVYENLLSDGRKIKAYVDETGTWKDIGTPQRYCQTAYARMVPTAFETAFGQDTPLKIEKTPLKGDGSDRRWYRLKSGPKTLVMVDHGIRPAAKAGEADAFAAIGRHLHNKHIAVPRIYAADTFAGLIFMQDLGDIHLQAHVSKMNQTDEIIECYRLVIDGAVSMWKMGARGFDSAWAYQGEAYDEDLILEKECRYFVEAFLQGVLKIEIEFDTLAPEFLDLAQKTVQNGLNGFMHRDLQSRNIMIHNRQPFFIDFQGGRLGPLQYDLASLLIDPYVNLAPHIQNQLVDYCRTLMSDAEKFQRGYEYCRITRNLQMLGAFGFLSRIKNKPFFEAYIAPATATLKTNLAAMDNEFPKLNKLVQDLHLKNSK